MGCDTFVALAPATHDGVTVFAKNSDRPPRECQRIVRLPRRTGAPGGPLRVQYLEIDDVPETAAILGSQPWWLWGLEHGVNEHRVAIGNETVFAREPLGATGLLGMDLVRLGLERGRTATGALEVMTALLEAHGQGGSGQHHVEFPYHNAFLVADPDEAWVLETSGRHWVARRVADVANISNGLALGAAWDRGAADVTGFAVSQGWWPADAGPVDFAAAYADDTGVPPNLCGARRTRGSALLDESRRRLGPAALRAVLRDHYDGGPVHRPRPFDDERFFAICMHADPLDNTTASMVAPLPAGGRVATTWVSLGSPCVGAFLPVYLDADVPGPLTWGGEHPDATSAWWTSRMLLDLVERDFARFAPRVRTRWDVLEARFAAEAETVEREAEGARQAGRIDDLRRILATFVGRCATSWTTEAARLVDELRAAG